MVCELMSIGIGGVKSVTMYKCDRCGRGVAIPPGAIVRIPANPTGDFCHEVVNPHTGSVIKRG